VAAETAKVGRQPYAGSLTTGELIDRLSRFQGPPGEFLVTLLAVQCRLAAANGGAILRIVPDAKVEIIAMSPPPVEGAAAPVWLAQAAESAPEVVSGSGIVVRPVHGPDELYGQPAKRHLVMIPLKGAQAVRGMAAFLVETSDQATLAASREKLEITASLLTLYEMQLTLARRQADLRRLRMATDILASVNLQDRFAGAAMAFCNEVAARWQCERVSLGFLKGRYVQLKAMSHTEKFSRKMQVVQDIEAAMEECIDQDVEVAYPPPPDASCVSRCAAELSKRHGPTAVVSLPLRKAGEPIAVLTAERPGGAAPSLEEVEPLRLACELCTARLASLHEQDRWFGAKAAAGARKGLGVLVGAKHTWLKIAAVAVLAAIVFLIVARGTYRVDASFVLEATAKQIVAAPFGGYIETVESTPGDIVSSGKTVLGTLDASEFRLQLAKARAERYAYQTQAVADRRDGKTAEAQVADADAERVAAEIRILEYRIAKARLVAPVSGYLAVGQLKRRIGAPVKTGDVLFEIAPLDSLQAELFVTEDQIADVREGQHGELAATSYPDQRIRFTVELINPVAEVVEGRNIFRVRVQLHQTHQWMRPGMEGVAKISIDTRHYAWLWTRRVVNWARMKLWL
jgi:multidrug resistance efflux pump